MFVTADDFPLPANLIESDDERKCQVTFRQTVSKGRIVTRFSTPEQASVKVVQAIRNWEAGRAGSPMPTQDSLLASQIKSVSYRVAVVNQSTLISDDEVKTGMAAL